MNQLICPECGARTAEGSERCDLCGTPLTNTGADELPKDIPEPTSTPIEAEIDGVYCNECGWKNPLDAKFCSRCGTRLQALGKGSGLPAGVRKARGPASASSAPGNTKAKSSPNENPGAQRDSDGSSSVSRYLGVVIGLAVLVVVALYLVTVVSKQRVSSPARAAVETPAQVRSAAVIEEYESVPVPDQHAGRLDSLRGVIANAAAEERRELQSELIDFFLDIGRIDRAAIEQQRVAQETGGLEDWRRAGDLLFDWMETVTPERRTDVALLTIDAYERVLQQDPGDLDARADLGWAYQYDPQNPMRAIEHTNRVLEEDPDHLAANYNRGVFLLRINRIEDAIAQLERVKQLAGPESPYSRQADMVIQSVRRGQNSR